MIKFMLKAQNQAIFLMDFSMATMKLHFQHLLLHQEQKTRKITKKKIAQTYVIVMHNCQTLVILAHNF